MSGHRDVLLLSRETGQRVHGPDGQSIGRLADLSADLDRNMGPHLVERLLVRRRGAPDLLVPWTAIDSFEHSGVRMAARDDPDTFAISCTSDGLGAEEILLVRDATDEEIRYGGKVEAAPDLNNCRAVPM